MITFSNTSKKDKCKTGLYTLLKCSGNNIVNTFFIDAFSKCLLNTYYMAGTVPGMEDSKMNRKQAWSQRTVFLVSGDKCVNIGMQLGTVGVRQVGGQVTMGTKEGIVKGTLGR